MLAASIITLLLSSEDSYSLGFLKKMIARTTARTMDKPMTKLAFQI